MNFVDLIIPLPLPNLYTYSVPNELVEELEIGKRVIVEFGRKKLYSCVIIKIHTDKPKNYEAKDILDVIDSEPIVNPIQIKLVNWISEYYMCTPGEVMNAALPSGLKLNSESKIQLHPQFNVDVLEDTILDQREELILTVIKDRESIRLQDLPKISGIGNPHKYIKSLIQREFIIIYEEVNEKYRPKTISKIRLTKPFCDTQKLEVLINELEKKTKQLNVVMAYMQTVNVFDNFELNTDGIVKKSLIERGISDSSLKTLIKNGVFEQFDEVTSRFPKLDEVVHKITLSEHQREAYNTIIKKFQHRNTLLLHGITGSGKTEIYIKLIEHAIEQEQQVLYLLPEIALTKQIVERLRAVFGDKLGVYHSKFSDTERVEVWDNIKKGRFKVIVGVRSSIFLPFDDLGLIIVDEEHDSSYKQFDPAPRYNARDSAVVLAKFHHANILLGTATPSVETYYQAKHDKYELIELNNRYGAAHLPEMHIINLQEERRKNTLKGLFSHYLMESIKEAINKGEQVILFQNRRGYSPTVTCDVCNWIPKCNNCDISLTLHQYKNEINCHYCGYKQFSPQKCPACGSAHITSVGFGTEQIEEELNIFFPDVIVDRMDLDTTRTKKNYEGIINKFEKGETQILVGTQMVTKGLDFHNVSVVGIMNADSMVHFPDYRAMERAYQTMVQVSGRAGRRDKKGKVVLQTYSPGLKLFDYVLESDFKGFYREEIGERQRLHYAPYHRLINIVIKHKEQFKTEKAANDFATKLRARMGHERVLGPSIPSISRIRNYYHFEIMIKLERNGINLKQAKELILDHVDQLKANKTYSGLRIAVNVDPV